jgi:DNA polymerase III sliding clamp (beta) subunit (PCNA family)
MIKSGKKVINIGNKDITDYPELPNTLNYLPIIEMKESDFTKDITKLHYFINEDSNNKMMKVYNLNMKQNRFEALDGYRVAVIDLVANKLNDKYNLLILGCINTILKKVLSEKSKDILRIGEYDNKYIVIKGNNYIYVQRMVDGLYYNIDNILRGEYDLSMTVNTKELMDIMKFDLELIENYDKKPVIIYYNQKINKSYVYLSTIKHNTCDELSFTDINIGKEFMIGFNPQFIYDACKCIEDKEIKIMMHNSKSPCIMEVTNEKYLILPVNINALGLEEGVKEYINKIA